MSVFNAQRRQVTADSTVKASFTQNVSTGTENSGATSEVFKMPNLSASSPYAATAREAGRLNALAVSDEEHEALLSERQTLLDKKFSGSISKKDLNRLAYVRWSLERIDDAKNGAALDRLEAQVETFENLLDEITAFTRQMDNLSRSKR